MIEELVSCLLSDQEPLKQVKTAVQLPDGDIMVLILSLYPEKVQIEIIVI